MNEQIKNLEAQCWEARLYGPPWFDASKFALLIIKECAKAIDTVNETASPGHGCYDWATFAVGDDILTHFGINNECKN